MNDAMRQLIVINALAVRQVHGEVEAIKYMQGNGFSTNEAFNVMDAYNQALNRIFIGQMP